ncbi:MAG: type I-E CRISPR-associated protein Cas7/Cse4/CasC [Bacillota bacterium]|nr:type I-E CRISPR-associated protein Cas7/Cse4/CasC [Bacillota bacterium]
MKNNNIYVDIHVIQTVPPSCVNRDDTGTPKSCTYGGVKRSRVSSQSWKRAVRLAFRDMYDEKDLANRTMKVVDMIESNILELNPEVKARDLANAMFKCAIEKNKKDKSDIKKEIKLEALFFMSHAQAKALAEIAINMSDKKINRKEIELICYEALKNNPSIDMALFGRMVASDPSLNYDAAAMVAHSISTHKVQTEFDYFTAVDDCASEENAGAGHLGTVEFNSSTLYRYASVNVSELKDNLAAETPKAVRDFVEAFLLSMPTGKITTFANRTLPNAVYITVRKDQPVNMAPAFECPVLPDENGGYVQGSKKQLVKYAKDIYESFVSEPEKAWTIGTGLEELGTKNNINLVLSELEELLTEMQ